MKHIKHNKGKILQIATECPIGVPTGFTKLDQIIRGFQPGYHVIGARPSVGKSSLAVGMLLRAAHSGYNSVFFSLEMKERIVMGRMAAYETGLSYKNIMHNRIPDDYKESLNQVDETLSNLPLYIDYTSRLKVGSIKHHLSKLKEYDIKPGIVFVDYIQRMYMENGNPANSAHEISEVSKGLCDIAHEFDCPMVVLSQLNRETMNASNSDMKKFYSRRPRMTDLKGSGAIEEDTDTLLLLHRPDYIREREDPNYENKGVQDAEIIINKNRNGACGVIECIWFPDVFKFFDESILDRNKRKRA
jgi:replicative DNA helicase